MRMAFVTFNNSQNAQNAVKKLNDTWFCGRKVSVSLSERRMSVNNDNDEEVLDILYIFYFLGSYT